MFYFAVDIGHHFFQSTLVCLIQIEESSFGLFFVNCFCICLHIVPKPDSHGKRGREFDIH